MEKLVLMEKMMLQADPMTMADFAFFLFFISVTDLKQNLVPLCVYAN